MVVRLKTYCGMEVDILMDGKHCVCSFCCYWVLSGSAFARAASGLF